MGRYDRKHVVITGGTSGIGLATAKLLLDRGARVLVTGRSSAALDSARRQFGEDALVVQSDVASLSDIDALAARVTYEFGPIDALFLNAASTRLASFADIFAEEKPALYDAMFTRATTLRFADADTPPQLSAAFGELRDAVSAVAPGQDVDTLGEVFWAGLHGLVTLARGGRLRAGHDSARVERLVDTLCGPTR